MVLLQADRCQGAQGQAGARERIGVLGRYGPSVEDREARLQLRPCPLGEDNRGGIHGRDGRLQFLPGIRHFYVVSSSESGEGYHRKVLSCGPWRGSARINMPRTIIVRWTEATPSGRTGTVLPPIISMPDTGCFPSVARRATTGTGSEGI